MSNLNFFRIMAGNGSTINSQDIQCNAGSIDFDGGPGVFYATAVVLGTGIGPITASFEAMNVPDGFRLVWSGSTVANSLIVGDRLEYSTTQYDGYTGSYGNVTSLTRKNWNEQADTFVNASAESVTYTSASFPPYPGTAPGPFIKTRGNTSSTVGERVNGQGNWGAQKGVLNAFPAFSSSCVNGQVKLCFFKHTTEPTSFDLIIDGPDSGTLWELLSLTCPGNDTSLHSSSIMDINGDTVVVYHTAPSFDLDVGMTLYENSALTTKFTSTGTYQTSSFWGSDKSMLVSGSTILGTAYPFNGGSGICFKNALNTGYSFITLADTGVITARSCTSTPHPDVLTEFYTTLALGKLAFTCDVTINQTHYHNGSGTLPAVGDTVYTNSSGTTKDTNKVRGASTVNSGNSIYGYETDSNGEVTSTQNCIP
ncbi:MAG: hypothetical protein GY775_11090 [Candidatus Scalindua sp.]|nr:hypothetical protein [Candidatus Scalindua sp.]